MLNGEWWNEFFSEVWPRIQAGGYPVERTASECDFISELLQLPPGARVLDIPGLDGMLSSWRVAVFKSLASICKHSSLSTLERRPIGPESLRIS